MRLPKLRTLAVVLALVSVGSCMALRGGPEPIPSQSPAPTPAPAGTTINVDGITPEQLEMISGAGPETEVQSAQVYEQEYLAALQSAADIAEAEWGTYIACRAQAIYADSLQQSQASNGRQGIEDVLLEKLKLVHDHGETAARGQRWYSHTADTADHFRQAGSDTVAILMLLQEMTSPSPAAPLCQQQPDKLWDRVSMVLDAGADLSREIVPVRLTAPTEEVGRAE